MKKNKLALALLGCGLILSSNVFAATATATFGVTANILGDCEILANDLNFGNVILGNGTTSSTTIQVTCPPDTSAYLRLNGGLNEQGLERHVSQNIGGNIHYVHYSLYTDASLSQPFTTFVSGPFGGVAIIGSGSTQVVDVYGEIPIQDSKPAGIYTDTIQVTVDY